VKVVSVVTILRKWLFFTLSLKPSYSWLNQLCGNTKSGHTNDTHSYSLLSPLNIFWSFPMNW